MSRITKSFARLMIRFRESRSITDVVRNFGVDWRCVKGAETEHLAQKYRNNWDFGHANSGSAEGFNTKVRLLMKQSYGLRGFKYLKIKIMDLPSRKIKASI